MKPIELMITFLLVGFITSDQQNYKRYPVGSYQKSKVTIGIIFGEKDAKSIAYAAYKHGANILEHDQNTAYSYYFKTVFVQNPADSFQMSGAICQLLVDGAVAVIGPLHPRTMNTIRSFTDYYDLLYITIDDPHIYAGEPEIARRATRVIKMRPTISDALVDFIYEQEWSRMLFIYDSEEALFRLRMLFELTNAHNYELSTDARFLRMNTDTDIIHYIDRQSRSHAKKQIILDLVNYQIKNRTFEQLKTTLNNRADYHYVILNSDYLELNHSYLIYGGLNFTSFNLIDYDNEKVLNFLKRDWVNNVYKTQVTKNSLFPSSLKFDKILQVDAALIMDTITTLRRVIESAGVPHEPTQTTSTDQPCTPETVPMWTARNLLPLFRKISFNGLTGLVKFNSTGFRQGFRFGIQEARIKQNLMKMGEWIQGKGIKRNSNMKHGTVKRPRKNKIRIVTSILGAPFLEVVKDDDGKILPGKYQGFCVDLMDAIASDMNFTYIIHEVKDGNFGANVNGTWNGMIGELIHHKADLAVAPLTITSSRERVVDFSTPFMEFGLSVMYLKLNQKQPELFAFMKPLSTDIWMCIGYAFLSVSVVLFLVSRLNPHEWNDNCFEADKNVKKSNGLSNDFSIFNSFWFSLSAFMQQGGDISPRSLSGRIVGGVWWFFTLIIVSSYTANLAAYLTVERMANPIQSFEDLAKQSKIKYGVVDSGSSKEFFSKSNLEIFERMWNFMEANGDVFVKTIKEGYRKVIESKGEYAFLLESTMNKYYNLQNGCVTTKIGANLDSGKGYGVATPPGSDLRDGINLAILKLKEKNIIPQMTQKWWDNRTECKQQEDTDQNLMSKNSVKLSQIEGLFLLLLGGLTLGIVLSLLELIYKCALEAKRQNKPFIASLKEMLDRSKRIPCKVIAVRDIEEDRMDNRVMFAI